MRTSDLLVLTLLLPLAGCPIAGEWTIDDASGLMTQATSTGSTPATATDSPTTALTTDLPEESSSSTSNLDSSSGPNLVWCGDGIIQSSVEECDDGNEDLNDGCSDNCKIESKYVFVSSKRYNGDLGGLSGADTKCQTLAEAAGLPGVYKAWLSSSSESPSTRFSYWPGYYRRVDGVIVAHGWPRAFYYHAPLEAPINKTEINGIIELGEVCTTEAKAMVWSAGWPDGTTWDNFYPNDRCYDWTATTDGWSHWGDANDVDRWSNNCSGNGADWCSRLAALYCFQQ